jgi:voltage-gated potassium channel
MRDETFRLLEGDARPYSLGWWMRWFLITLIVTNVVAVILQSDRDIEQNYHVLFRWFEWFSVAVFSVEYLARIWTAVEIEELKALGPIRARIRYALTPLALIDLLAVAPAYLGAFFSLDLRQLRVFRLLRLLKLGHHSPSVLLYGKVLREQTKTLLSALVVMFVLVVVSASLLFFAERGAQPDAFGSVAQSLWWAVVTLTTVGYGDVAPVTPLGKLLAGLVMLLGVATVAVPAGILAGKFSDELQAQRKAVERSAEEAAGDGDLDDAERDEIVTMGLKAGLSRRTILQILETYGTQEISPEHCPHCGKRLT